MAPQSYERPLIWPPQCRRGMPPRAGRDGMGPGPPRLPCHSRGTLQRVHDVGRPRQVADVVRRLGPASARSRSRSRATSSTRPMMATAVASPPAPAAAVDESPRVLAATTRGDAAEERAYTDERGTNAGATHAVSVRASGLRGGSDLANGGSRRPATRPSTVDARRSSALSIGPGPRQRQTRAQEDRQLRGGVVAVEVAVIGSASATRAHSPRRRLPDRTAGRLDRGRTASTCRSGWPSIG